MSKVIHEEEQQQQGAAGGAQDKVRKAARQLAYDVRYKVKQGFKDGQKADPNSLKRAYMQQLGKSPAPGPVKALAKKMLIGEEYDFFTVESSLSSVVGKVFTTEEEVVEEVVVSDEPSYLQNLDEGEEKKYPIRVKDKKTGKSYVRTATRAKISELRANPNISSVEMTGYGKDYAAPTDGKKAKKDYDGDGKVESGTDEYMGSRDKAIKKAMAKEEFIGEVNAEDENPDANEKKIDMMKGKNKVTINPKEGTIVSHNELEGELVETLGDVTKGATTPKKEEEDERGMQQKVTMVRNKLRARGMQVSGYPRGSDGPRNMKTGPEMNADGEEVKESNVERAIKMNLASRNISEVKLGDFHGGPLVNIKGGDKVTHNTTNKGGGVGAAIGGAAAGAAAGYAAAKLTQKKDKKEKKVEEGVMPAIAGGIASGVGSGVGAVAAGLVAKKMMEKDQKKKKKDEEVSEEMSMDRRKRAAEIGAKSSSYKTRFAAMKLASGENKPVRGKGNKAAKRAAEVKEATYPSDFRNPDGSKRAVAKKKPASANASAYNIKRNAGGQRVIDDE